VVCELGSVPLPDGRLLLSSRDHHGALRRWDAVTGREIGSAVGGRDDSGCPAGMVIASTERGPQIFTAEEDAVYRRDAVTGAVLSRIAEGGPSTLVEIDGRPHLVIERGFRHVEFRPLLGTDEVVPTHRL
jgi:hypothetical protein